jgi:hypothetical protein
MRLSLNTCLLSFSLFYVWTELFFSRIMCHLKYSLSLGYCILPKLLIILNSS